jgi:hypothetical protein
VTPPSKLVIMLNWAFFFLQVDGSSYRKVMRKIETVEALLKGHKLARSPTLRPRLLELARKEALGPELKALKKQAKAAQSIVLKVT